MLNKSLCDIENKRLPKILERAQNLNFNPNYIAGVRNEIADALSRLCRIVSKKEHSPDDNLRLLPMSKNAEIYKKELEVQDQLVERLEDIGGEDLNMLSYSNILRIRLSTSTYLMTVS